MPLSPDLRGCEHATFSAHVSERSLAGTVCTTTGDTRDTCDSTTWLIVLESSPDRFFMCCGLVLPDAPVPHDSAEVCSPAFSLTAYACLLFLAIPVWTLLDSSSAQFCPLALHAVRGEFSYWTTSGRIGELKTAGRGWVSPVLEPSPPKMPTVGRFDILTFW
jgi:hypothetical protein